MRGRVGETQALGAHAPWIEPRWPPPHSRAPKQNASSVDAASWERCWDWGRWQCPRSCDQLPLRVRAPPGPVQRMEIMSKLVPAAGPQSGSRMWRLLWPFPALLPRRQDRPELLRPRQFDDCFSVHKIASVIKERATPKCSFQGELGVFHGTHGSHTSAPPAGVTLLKCPL